jgi:hypothetical protein
LQCYFGVELENAEISTPRVRIKHLEAELQNTNPDNITESFDQPDESLSQHYTLLSQSVISMQNSNTRLKKKFVKQQAMHASAIAMMEKQISDGKNEINALTASLIRVNEINKDLSTSDPHAATASTSLAEQKDEAERKLQAVQVEMQYLDWDLEGLKVECKHKQMEIDQLLHRLSQTSACAGLDQIVALNQPAAPPEIANEISVQDTSLQPDMKPQLNNETGIQDKFLSRQLQDFFHLLRGNTPHSDVNTEENLYDQFILDHPIQDMGIPSQYTREQVVRAMDKEWDQKHNGRDFEVRKLQKVKQHSKNVRMCKKKFARCLEAMGGKLKRVKGKNHWINIGMCRKPRYRPGVYTHMDQAERREAVVERPVTVYNDQPMRPL